MPIEEGARLILDAVDAGITLLDTARAYRIYPYVARAINMMTPAERERLQIIGRSYDYTFDGMEASFREAREEMHAGRIDVFMIHEVESAAGLLGHGEALECLSRLKRDGLLRAAGISTHYVAAVRAAAENPGVDVIFAILNRSGLGIMDGSREDMESALGDAARAGKGILLMKALGGGHLFREAGEALAYARDLPFVHSVILGIQDREEMDFARAVFDGDAGELPPALSGKRHRKLFVEPWCSACGKCVAVCPFHALEIREGRLYIDAGRCMLCSYCAGACPGFCLKVV
jgi:aryl-alcohol dehydrogenase-like predicted oxidoreductase/NAD-dependent dihydropyrimidine dehydrogenase PreA subunit